MTEHKHLRPPTAILTRGFDPSLSLGSARPAVFRSSTYVFSSPEAAERAFSVAAGRSRAAEGENIDLIYARINHPNAQILEDQVVPLESGATTAAVFNSGMAAITTALFTFMRPGDNVVYTTPIYGGTQHFLHEILEPFGVKSTAVQAGSTKDLEDAIDGIANLRVVLIETPANPTMRMTDIRVAAEKARRRSPPALVMVDNTFLGPAFQHPIVLGADLVLYSATKYLSGFSDMIAGIALAQDPELIERMRQSRVMFGNILPPDECWLLDSRLPTVTLRMNRSSKNAQRIAERLRGHRSVQRVLYPALFEDPEQIRIRDAQCDYPGGLLTLDLGTRAGAFDFLRSLRVARNAVSLGGVETLACHPKTTTHSSWSENEFAAAGITDGLVRVSVGIEDWRDILADFEQALDRV